MPKVRRVSERRANKAVATVSSAQPATMVLPSLADNPSQMAPQGSPAPVEAPVVSIPNTGTRGRRISNQNTNTICRDDIQFEIDRLLRASTAESTQETYDRGLTLFATFRSEFQLQSSWPPPLDQVVQFVAYMSVKGLAWSTARTYLMGIAFKCKVSGGLDVTQHFLVKKLIEGFRRSTHEKDTRLPISITLLKQLLAILPAICRDNYEAKMFSAAFTLAFFGFLRVGEITVCSLKKIGHPLFRRDIELIADDKSVRVTIRHSKTDQVGKGTTIIIPPTEGSLSVFEYVSDFLVDRPNIEGPFFCHFGGKPLSRYQFSAVLKKALGHLGLHAHFTSHSFRIGAATMAATQGWTEAEIQTAGRWKSAAVKAYIRIPLQKITRTFSK